MLWEWASRRWASDLGTGLSIVARPLSVKKRVGHFTVERRKDAIAQLSHALEECSWGRW